MRGPRTQQSATTPLVACPDRIYSNRNLVERFRARLKEWPSIAARFEKTASSFMSVLALAAALDWRKAQQAVEFGEFSPAVWWAVRTRR